MCSYKAWIWFTAIYSIPLILVLILGDIVSLIGLNAPQLLKYDIKKLSSPSYNFQNDEFLNLNSDEMPKLGESAAIRRMAYESQFIKNFEEEDNSLEVTDRNLDLNNESKPAIESREEPNDIRDDLKDKIDETTTINNIELKDLKTNELVTNDPQTSTTKEELTSSTKPIETTQSEKQSISNQTTSNNEIHTFKSTTTTKHNDQMQNDDSSEKGGEIEDDDKQKSDSADTEHKKEPSKDDDSQESYKSNSQPSRERSEILKLSWNEFMNGLYENERKWLLNIFIFVKLGFRIVSLTFLPLLIIGNHTSKSKYIKPFKYVLLIQFLFCLVVTIYYAIVSTKCNYYRDIKDWLPKHFEDPDHETGKNFAILYLLITFADLFPFFCIISLILISKREHQIIKKKDESSQENGWDMQLRPIGLPRIKTNTNSDHISPLNLHFNQPSNHNDDNLPLTGLTAGLITNEEISVNNQPFSYTSNNQSNNQSLPCYDNHGFNKN